MGFWSSTREEKLAYAMENNHVSTVGTLMNDGVNWNDMLVKFPGTLTRMVSRNCHEAAELFLSRTGISMQHPAVKLMQLAVCSKPAGTSDWTLYHRGTETKEWIKVLTAAGCVFDAKTKDGQGFLHALLEPYTTVPKSSLNAQEMNSFTAICKMLPGDLRERLNTPDAHGRTALHYAAKIKDRGASTTRLTEFMLKNGADPRYKDKMDVSAETILMLYSGDAFKAMIEEAKKSFPAIDQARPAPAAEIVESVPAPAEVSAPAPAVAPLSDSGWVTISADAIAHVENVPALGYKLTDIFNFARRERVSMSQNLSSGSESRETRGFDDIMDKAVLEKAHDAYAQNGGTIPRDVIYPRRKDIAL